MYMQVSLHLASLQCQWMDVQITLQHEERAGMYRADYVPQGHEILQCSFSHVLHTRCTA